jgi:hypothetical protein
MSNTENIWGGVICKALDFLLLQNNGSYFSFTNFHNKKIPLDIRKHTFTGKYKQKCKKSKYSQIVNKIKKLDVFAYKVNYVNVKTIVHKKNTFVKQDELIAVSTTFHFDNLFSTSFEKVSVLEETENSLILCMSTCSENIVNGYYLFLLNYNEDKRQIQMKYTKVQNFTTLPLRILVENINNTAFIDNCKTSIMDTFNYLFQKEIFTKEDVKYSYE